MNRVKFVPADKAARMLHATSVMVIECAKQKHWPYPPPNNWKRRPTKNEAVMVATRRGWVLLASLPAGERRHWIHGYRSLTKGEV